MQPKHYGVLRVSYDDLKKALGLPADAEIRGVRDALFEVLERAIDNDIFEVDEPGSLTLTDPDGDRVECFDVGAFGQPMLGLAVYQETEEAHVNLTVAMASRLRDYLDGFVKRAMP